MSQGIVRRQDKVMSRADIDRFLERTAFAHFASVSANGDPYVVPNLFIYADAKIFSHTSRAGHFRSNIEARPRVCFEAAEMGAVFPYGEFECDSSVSYTSVVGFGPIRVEDDRAAKTLFFDRLMAKYSDPRLNRPKELLSAARPHHALCAHHRRDHRQAPAPANGERTVASTQPDEITGRGAAEG